MGQWVYTDSSGSMVTRRARGLQWVRVSAWAETGFQLSTRGASHEKVKRGRGHFRHQTLHPFPIDLCFFPALGMWPQFPSNPSASAHTNRGKVGTMASLVSLRLPARQEPIMAWMHPDFSFQGSRPVTKGFKDPRDPEVGLGHTMTFNLFGFS